MHGHSFDQGALIKVWIPPMSIYTRVLCYRWSYYGCSILYVFWQVGYQWVVYATTLRSRVKDRLDIMSWLLLSQWSSSDMNFQPRGWLNTTCTIVTCSGLWLWDMWDIYEWYCYFIAELYWEAWGLFWKRSVSLFLRGVRFFVCFLVGLLGFCSCCSFVLVVAWLLDGRHLRYRFTLFSCVGMDNLNQ